MTTHASSPPLVWRKSSHSQGSQNCVEVGAPALAWTKSSYSQGANNCVEVAVGPRRVGVRDSKSPGASALEVSAKTWARFTGGIPRHS